MSVDRICENERRVLVAGAGGAVGWPLCNLLIAEGWKVFGTTRSCERARLFQRVGVEPVIVDVYDAEKLCKLLVEVQPEVVVHQLTDLPPGLDPKQMPEGLVRNMRIRDVGTRHLIAASIRARATRIVVQSIAFAYKRGQQPHMEGDPLESDALCAFEQQVIESPLEGLILRYGHFYGPGTGFDEPHHVPAPVHVDAAADAARRALVHGEPGVYNVAEEDGAVDIGKARALLGWDPAFRLNI
ncbi:NAD-dependent epimerase/dehydratase family protein [Acidihalobacter prosperus]|uniref:NAD-dependent epimerase/dehydratase family protein n=1 Tax=Acidihalobacter prosperus TaxID=160660 RepID=UPI0005046D0D|nr:NAD(P)-dependent oxidoreductase [Acidihalobacter prosperus]